MSERKRWTNGADAQARFEEAQDRRLHPEDYKDEEKKEEVVAEKKETTPEDPLAYWNELKKQRGL